MVILCNRALPGEVVLAKITSVKKGYAIAEKEATIRQHANAVQAPCSHFGPCGGCTLQNLDYASQLQAKRDQVLQALQRIASLVEATEATVHPMVPCQQQYHYRNKMQFSFSSSRWIVEGGKERVEKKTFSLGLLKPGSFHEVLPISTCWIQDDTANVILQTVAAAAPKCGLVAFDASTKKGSLVSLTVRRGTSPNDGGPTYMALITSRRAEDAQRLTPLVQALVAAVPRLASIVHAVSPDGRGVGAARISRITPLHGSRVIQERLCGLWFDISPESFFQTNTAQAEVLYEMVSKAAALRPDDVAADLYCGTGTIALRLARDCAHVHAYDSSAAAVSDAASSARRNGVRNVSFGMCDLRRGADVATALTAHRPAPRVVVVDPAREGLSPPLLGMLRGCEAQRLVYVSCNPNTLARDLRALCEGVGPRFRFSLAWPIDMFPHTDHVEVLAVLDRA